MNVIMTMDFWDAIFLWVLEIALILAILFVLIGWIIGKVCDLRKMIWKHRNEINEIKMEQLHSYSKRAVTYQNKEE